MEIIERLKKGQITSEKAIKLIQNYNPDYHRSRRKSSKLKISIYDKSSGKSIRIPAIPFWLITSLGNLGLRISKLVASKSNTIDDETKKYLTVLDDFDLREIFSAFRHHEPWDLVNVEEQDGDIVKISTL